MIQKAMLLIALSNKEKAGTITAVEKLQLAETRRTIVDDAAKVDMKVVYCKPIKL